MVEVKLGEKYRLTQDVFGFKAGTVVKPSVAGKGTIHESLIHGAKTPEMVMFETGNGGGLFVHPKYLESAP